MTTKFDVFLCHNSKDKEAVETVARTLKNKGLKPWLDKWELRPGQPWQRALEQAIADIGAAAVFVGKDGLGPWQNMEQEAFLRKFVSSGSPVIPVILPGAPQKPELPVFLEGFMWVDFRVGDPDPMGQLIWGITGVKPDGSVSAGPAASSAPAPSSSAPLAAAPPSSSPSTDASLAAKGLARWREKLAYYLEQEAIAADPSVRFQLKKQIEEAREKIRELGGG